MLKGISSMQRMKKLFEEVKNRTGYDIKKHVKIVLCEDEKKFLAIQSKMKRKKYIFPRHINDVDAFYFSEDKFVAVSPKVKEGTLHFDRVILHELFHHLLSHEIPQERIDHMRKNASRKRKRIMKGYMSVGRRMPWSIEERLCDLFAYAICPHVQKGSSKMREISLEMMMPLMSKEVKK